jgi:predicted ArsR family transcriptional regulator
MTEEQNIKFLENLWEQIEETLEDYSPLDGYDEEKEARLHDLINHARNNGFVEEAQRMRDHCNSHFNQEEYI